MIRSFIANSVFLGKKGLRNKLKELSDTEFFSESKIREYQEEKLKKIIFHAYNNVPYYHKLFNDLKIKPDDIQTIEDLRKLPILEKKDIQNNSEQLLATNVPPDFSRITSGSTGKPLTVAVNNESKIVELALVQRFNNDIGNTFETKKLLLWGGHAMGLKDKLKSSLKQWLYNYKLVDTYSITNEVLEDLANDISKGKYKNLRGYTSAVYILAQRMKAMNVKTKLNSVSVSAEQLFDYYRKDITEVFGSDLYDQYGCGETNSIAFECGEHKGMHQAFEHSVFEVVDNKDEPSKTGHILITNLDNYAMPLLRYRNGDLATLSDSTCSCGRHSLLIEKIEGRSYDFITGVNGTIAHGGFFDDALLESGFTTEFNIKGIRIIQVAKDQIDVEYVTDDIVSDAAKNKVVDIYQSFLGDMRINFKKVAKINTTKTGKRKFIISYDEYKKLSAK